MQGRKFEVYQTGRMGPAGTNTFGIAGLDDAPVAGCFMCPANGTLAFRPRVLEFSDALGYVITASRPVTVSVRGFDAPQFRLLPSACTTMAIPFYHLNKGPGFNTGFRDNWLGDFNQLLPLVHGLTPDMPWSYHAQFHFAAGARPQGWEKQPGTELVAPHGFYRVTYGRDLLDETAADSLGQIQTKDLGLDAILHQSRREAGSMPDDQRLWDVWEGVKGEVNAVDLFHSEAFGLAA